MRFTVLWIVELLSKSFLSFTPTKKYPLAGASRSLHTAIVPEIKQIKIVPEEHREEKSMAMLQELTPENPGEKMRAKTDSKA